MTIAFEQCLQRSQIVGQSANDLVFFKAIGHRNLNGPIKWQLSAIDFLERLVGFDQNVVVFQ